MSCLQRISNRHTSSETRSQQRQQASEAGPATRLVAPGKQVGVQARRQASDAASVLFNLTSGIHSARSVLRWLRPTARAALSFATSCGSTTSESIRQPNYSYWNGDASAMQAERAAAAAALLEPPPPPAVNPLDHPTLNDLLADSEDEEEGGGRDDRE